MEMQLLGHNVANENIQRQVEAQAAKSLKLHASLGTYFRTSMSTTSMAILSVH